MTRYRKAAELAVVSRDDRVFVSGLLGDVVVLEGNAIIIWECADEGSTADVIQRVAERVGLPDNEIAPETERFLESLRRDGLLIAE